MFFSKQFLLIAAIVLSLQFFTPPGAHAQTPAPGSLPTQDEMLESVGYWIRQCDVDSVKFTLGNPRLKTFDVNHQDTSTRDSMLEEAVETTKCFSDWDEQALFKYLLGLPGINVNLKGPSGLTPLERAVLDNRTVAIAALSAKPESIFSDPVTPYPLFSRQDGYGEVSCAGCTLLEFASSYLYRDGMKALLDSKVIDVNAGSQGSTPLIAAAGFGNLDAVQLLLDHGANVNQKNQKGFTALRAARESEKNPDFSPLVFYKRYSSKIGVLFDPPGPDISKETRNQIINLLIAHGARDEVNAGKGNQD